MGDRQRRLHHRSSQRCGSGRCRADGKRPGNGRYAQDQRRLKAPTTIPFLSPTQRHSCMITRRIGSGLGAALPTVLLGLSLNAPALAQDPADPAAGEAAPAGDRPSTAAFDEAPAPPPAEEPPPSAPPPEPEPAEPEPAPPAVREPAEAAIAPEPATPAAEGATSSERERAAALLGVELLPGSAFPEVYTRGLKYG